MTEDWKKFDATDRTTWPPAVYPEEDKIRGKALLYWVLFRWGGGDTALWDNEAHVWVKPRRWRKDLVLENVAKYMIQPENIFTFLDDEAEKIKRAWEEIRAEYPQ